MAPPTRTTNFAQTVLVLAALLFAGNFLYARLFGIYDDDFIFTLPAFSWTWPEARAHIGNAFCYWPQGRPVGFGLTHLVSYVSAQASSLGLGYLIGFAIILLNAVLLHRLARSFLSTPAALLVAAVFILYPADTSKAILMHRINLHLNLTFLLVALLCYVGGRRWQAYLIAPLSFLVYEPVFLVFLLAPLLVSSFKEASWKRCLTHGLLCTASMAAILVLRNQIGDPRVGETFGDPVEVVQRIAQALFIGPKVALTAMVARPFEALYATDALLWIAVLLCAGAFVSVARGEDQSIESGTATRATALWIAGVGAIGLLLSYLVCFRSDYWPPVMTIGRLSGYHAAGSVGASLMIGGLFGFALEFRPRMRQWLIAAAALYCGLLVSFGIEVQRIDYVKHTEQQAGFWRNIIDTSGEWKPDTVILVDISGNDSSRPFTPGMPLWWTVNFAPTMLEHLIEWPAEWAAQPSPRNISGLKYPRVYGYMDNFATASEDDAITVKTPAWMGSDYWPRVRDGKFIFFRFEGGRMARVTGPVTIGGREFVPMNRLAIPAPQLPTSSFYSLLFVRETEWQTILKARNYPR
jgi:hypothetical protein